MSFPTEGSDIEREREEFVGVLRDLALPPIVDRLARGGDVTALAVMARIGMRVRMFPAFRRALCEAVAQETGMKVADVIALATPKE